MRTELGLVFKHVNGGAQKVNKVNYLTIPPLPADEYYYEEKTYVVYEQTVVSDQTPKAPIRKIGVKVMETKVGTMVNTTQRINMFEMGTTTAITTSIGVTMLTRMIGVGPMFHLKKEMLLLGFGGNMARDQNMLQKMLRTFDTSDEHTKEMRDDLANILQKVDAHAVLIKHLEL